LAALKAGEERYGIRGGIRDGVRGAAMILSVVEDEGNVEIEVEMKGDKDKEKCE